MDLLDDEFAPNFAGKEPRPETGRGQRQPRPTVGMMEHCMS